MASLAPRSDRSAQGRDDGGGPPAIEPRYDESQSFIHRLTRCGLLNADEEKRLALLIAQGGIKGARAKARLVECNMRLVVSIAKSYRASGIPFEDLVQEGAIGLMTATDRFDPGRGYRFSTYATQWIRQAIGRAVDNKSKSIRLPAHVSESLRKMERARAEVRRETGEDPSQEVLSERTGIPLRKISTLLFTTQEPVSLDMPVGEEESTPLGALLYDKEAPDPQDTLLTNEVRHQIAAILGTLDERERLVIWRRYGFDGEETTVLQQIGEELNISRERVRQIEAQAIRKLRLLARKHRLRELVQS
jgi:RNA polymerase primary sigma factor